MRGQPTDDDLRKVSEFREILQLPTPQEIRLAIIKSMPPSKDPADCICAVLKECVADSPCPHCRSNPVGGCPHGATGAQL